MKLSRLSRKRGNPYSRAGKVTILAISPKTMVKMECNIIIPTSYNATCVSTQPQTVCDIVGYLTQIGVEERRLVGGQEVEKK